MALSRRRTLPFPRFLAFQVSVWEWQFGQRSSRLSGLLLSALPSVCSISRTIGLSFHSEIPQHQHSSRIPFRYFRIVPGPGVSPPGSNRLVLKCFCVRQSNYVHNTCSYGKDKDWNSWGWNRVVWVLRRSHLLSQNSSDNRLNNRVWIVYPRV